tara:strand:- start:667 stop:957 length:291 start_codon:yes stop_codon:yes gene_type:complete
MHILKKINKNKLKMSRYNSRMEGLTKDNLYVDINWGFDPVLGYWYDIIETREGVETVMEDWSSKTHGGSRSKMLEFLIKYNLPEEHRSMVALDMQF